MSIRFRRSIKICKGLRVNINKNSVGLSVGPRGIGYTFNTKGKSTFHAGIPGTGLSYVTSNNVSNSVKKTSKLVDKSKYDGTKIHFKLQDDGKWKYFYEDGSEVFDQELINVIKKQPSFIEQKNRILNDRNERVSKEVEEYNSSFEELINIYKMCAYPILDDEVYTNLMNEIKLETYIEEQYSVPQPSIETITQFLNKEAKKKIFDLKLWDLKNRRNEYVQANIDERFRNATNAWKKSKDEFENQEKEKASNINNEYKKIYDEAITHSKNIIDGDEETINDEVEMFLSEIELPLEFNINYSYSKSDSSLLIDLDLPEIEDMPSEVATQLASGMKKMKPKTKQEMKDDYKQFVFGFALFLTSHLFNISPKIHTIVISGYTQRRDKTGEVKDDYIYSIIFEREKFKKYNPLEENLIYICNSFKNRCNVDMYSNFKPIEPYTSIDE